VCKELLLDKKIIKRAAFSYIQLNVCVLAAPLTKHIPIFPAIREKVVCFPHTGNMAVVPLIADWYRAPIGYIILF
jgi:hypothetical protein